MPYRSKIGISCKVKAISGRSNLRNAKEVSRGGLEAVSRVLCARHLAVPGMAAIHLGPALPPASSDLPGNVPSAMAARRSLSSHIWSCPRRGLASRHVTVPLVGSYPTFSPLPLVRRSRLRGGMLSVPLSRGLRPVGVTHRRDPWGPDFPPALLRERPPCLQYPIGNEPPNIVYPKGSRSSSSGMSACAMRTCAAALGVVQILTKNSPRPGWEGAGWRRYWS